MHGSTVSIGWHHLVLDTPRAWEVVGYKNDPTDARLVLSDRHGETLDVFARTVREKPALTRRLVDLAAANMETAPSEKEIRRHISDHAGWRVFTPEDAAAPVLAARHLADPGVLVLLVLPPHPRRADPGLVERVLASYRPNTGEDRFWAVFGLEVTLPKEMELRRVDPMPAAQALRFENRSGESVTFHRYGMMPLILGEDDMAAFFARLKGKRRLLRREGVFRKDGRYDGVELAYETRGRGGFDALIARPWRGRVWVWRRDDLMRLCCVDHHAPKEHPMDDLLSRIHCR